MAKNFTLKSLEWPESEIYFKSGDRVEFRPGFASVGRLFGLHRGQRGKVIDDAPLSVMSGVLVQWDGGPESVVSGAEAKKLGVLELLGEL